MGNIKPPKKTIEYKAIIERLIQAREAAGLSQNQTAKMVYLAPASFCDIENFRNQLSVERLLQLVEIYGVSIEWVLTGVNPYFDPQTVIDAATRVTRDTAKLIHMLTMSASK